MTQLVELPPADAGLEPHRHSGPVFGYVLEGRILFVLEGQAPTEIAAGGCSAWLVYRYLGLKFVSRSWLNLDTSWAVSLILVGVIALGFGLAS